MIRLRRLQARKVAVHDDLSRLTTSKASGTTFVEGRRPLPETFLDRRCVEQAKIFRGRPDIGVREFLRPLNGCWSCAREHRTGRASLGPRPNLRQRFRSIWKRKQRNYRNHLNPGLVWFSINGFVPGCQMVRYLKGGLEIGLKRCVYGPKCTVIKWSAKSPDFTIWIPDTHTLQYSDESNLTSEK